MSLLDVLQLERIEENIFRGQSQDVGTPQVFGGQVLAQALEAAQSTVPERSVHSVHAYFLNKGDFEAPIVYNVDRSRDGRSFTARRVVAIQHGRPIFTLSCSFQIEEVGLEFAGRIPMPDPPHEPDSEQTAWRSRVSRGLTGDDADQKIRALKPTSYFYTEIANVDQTPEDAMQVWLKIREAVPAQAAIHKTLLAYVSDLGLLLSTLVPHGYAVLNPMKLKKFGLASIDHAIWYHRETRVDEWLLYHCQAISTSNARGLARGSFYSVDGELIATTMQEGLIRQLTK